MNFNRVVIINKEEDLAKYREEIDNVENGSLQQ